MPPDENKAAGINDSTTLDAKRVSLFSIECDGENRLKGIETALSLHSAKFLHEIYTVR